MLKIFATSFYGSPLWSLNSEEHLKLNRSWNTVVKMVWDLPFETHKRSVESLTDVPHIQASLHGRYIGFIENLYKSEKIQLKMLLSLCQYDQSANTGQNIAYLMELHDQENLEHLISNKHVIKKKRVNPLEEGEEWKIKLIEELSMIKLGFLSIDMEEKDINRMLKDLTTS